VLRDDGVVQRIRDAAEHPGSAFEVGAGSSLPDFSRPDTGE
jgi:hypothetical protein